MFWAQGKMREGVVFGANLLLTRRVSAKLGENRLWIRDEVAAPCLDQWAEFPAPRPNQPELVYYHDLATAADGTTMVGFAHENDPDFGAFGLYLKYDKGVLPHFIQWKKPAEGT